MDFIVAYNTDVGNVKKLNQDSLSVKVVNSSYGKIIFAVICDGMGGLAQGELASKEVVIAFNNWFSTQLVQMITGNMFSKEQLYIQWGGLIEKMNDRLSKYAASRRIRMGTTLSVLLIFQGDYYICHVGDSRIYRIDSKLTQITSDHTLTAQEVQLGKITKEEALRDSRKNILLQCIGASNTLKPQFGKGRIAGKVTFLLASDGFVHMISEKEIYQYFEPKTVADKSDLSKKCKFTTNLVMARGERDNITVIAIAITRV